MGVEIQNILLINSGNDPGYQFGVVHGESYPPLGIISIATTIKREFNDINVYLYDGLITDKEIIKKRISEIKPQIVGISVLATSYKYALEIATHAKKNNAITIFGNDQAAITGDNMLMKQNVIDYISKSDIGELAFIEFIQYLRGYLSIDKVHGLSYRKRGEIVTNDAKYIITNKNRDTFLDIIPIPDRTLLPISEYTKHYKSSYPDEDILGTSTINRFRGCDRNTKRCHYCGIADLTIMTSSPEVFWKDISDAQDHGINILFEAGDSFSSLPKYLDKLAITKPTHITNIKLFVYTQAIETNHRLVENYKKIGVHRVNIGLDSGDNSILKILKGPKDSTKLSLRSLQLFKAAGIKVYASFVLGSIGETNFTIHNTLNFVKYLIKNSLIDGIEAQPLFPELNSTAGRILIDPGFALNISKKVNYSISNMDLLKEYEAKYRYHENPDPVEISKDYARVFSKVSYEEQLSIVFEILKYAKKYGIQHGTSWITNTINRL